MIITRGARPERDFSIISNAVLRDGRLSFRARGVLCCILSFPDGYQVSSDRIAEMGKEGRDAIRTCFAELEATGYLVRAKRQNERGLWETSITVHDCPIQSEPATENPASAHPASVHPASGFPGAIKKMDNEDKKKEDSARTKLPGIVFNGTAFENLSDEQVAIWESAYPAINARAEIRRAAAWLNANPANKKSDYKRFLNNWLSRAQDKAPRVQAHVSKSFDLGTASGRTANYYAGKAAFQQQRQNGGANVGDCIDVESFRI